MNEELLEVDVSDIVETEEWNITGNTNSIKGVEFVTTDKKNGVWDVT